MSYTSYERVKTALEHKEPDRVPFDIGGALVAGINIETLKNLRKHLGLPEKAPQIADKISQSAKPDDDLIERLNIDFKTVMPRGPSQPGLSKNLDVPDNLFIDSHREHYRLIDEFGIVWQMPIEYGLYYDLYKPPFKYIETVEEVENYPWPDALDPARYVDLKRQADQTVYEEKKAYVLERMSAGMWENAMWMTGHEKLFMDMLLNEKLFRSIMDKFVELKMKYWEKALEAVGENVMLISTADDLGSQETLLVSLELYKKLVWPYHKKLFQFIRKKAKSKVYIFFHSDGAMKEAIPLLLEAGVDILNPVQVNCRGMDTKALKKDYGKDLTFWGGSCDNNVLAFGTPEEVRDETKRRIDDLAPGGGFIFAPIHIIQKGVPPENIMSWWETLQEYGIYT